MKKYLRYIIVFFSLLVFSADLFSQGAKSYFKDKDGFFFYIGIDVPKKNVNLVWDELRSKPVKRYVLERSFDGKIFVSVISQSAADKPRDIRSMSIEEQEAVQPLNNIVYTTEAEGKGRFVFNEVVPNSLINANLVLRSAIENRINWDDRKYIESLFHSLKKEQPLIYRVKFIYEDGSSEYSGLRSLSDYLFFILKRALLKTYPNDAGSEGKNTVITNPSALSNKQDSLVTLAACPPINGPPACVIATGNSNVINGTCCTYTEQEFQDEQAGGPPSIPCSTSNNGVGYCTPLILDCPPASSDPCCAGNGCGHYAVCGCKPWECCVYTLPPSWYVVASSNLVPPTATASSSSPPCALGNTSTVSVSGGTPTFVYSWSPGGASTSSLTNVTSGNYTVTVTDVNGCTAVSSVAVNPGNPSPQAIFTANTVCLGLPTVFTDNSTISTGSITGWSWTFGDGGTSTQQNPSYAYTAAGTYSASLTATSNAGCPTTVTNVVTVTPQPVASFSVTVVCLGNSTQFTDLTTGGGTSWSWTFGDGGTSTQQNPSYTYTAAGTYSATLVSTASPGGCNDNTVNVVTVQPQPVADFSATTVCLGNPTQFTDLSTGGATSWSWAFGDGNTSTQQNPSNTYSAAGTYTATLTSTAPGGCNSISPETIIVHPQPVASFIATTVCLGNPTQFTDLSTGGGTAWTWSFGDGGNSSQQSPAYTYSAAGTYTVTLNSSGAGGCNNTFPLVVTVNPQPVALFSVSTVCLGLPTQFTDLSTGGATQWSWAFGDGNTSTQQSPANTYSAAGTYTATLTSTGPGGCNSLLSQQVTVFSLSVASFSVADICLNTNPAVFSDLSTGAAQWLWDFGDGTPTSSQSSPTHVYGAPGTYSVSLLVQSGGACIDSIVQVINVNPVPDAIFTSSTVCFNNPTQFTDQSLGAPTQWFWDFGDGNTDTLQNPSHTYNTPGTYTATLVSTNSSGCSDTLPLTVLINPLPAANFIAPTVCIGSTTCFQDTTVISSGVISAWSWNFNDTASGANNISNIQNPCHLFNATGTYNVFLTATSSDGCQSTINLPVNVTLPPIASFTATTACMNTPTMFNDLSTGAAQWSWSFGDGGTSTLQHPSHTYLGYGSYVVTLVSSTGGFCSDTTLDTITVNPVPVVAFISDSVCVGEPTTFTDASFIPLGSIVAWTWDFGDLASGTDNVSALQNPTHVFSAAGTYTVTLTTTSALACSSTSSYFVLVYPGPTAAFSFSPASPINISNVVSFSDQSTGGPVQWWWNFGDEDTSISQNPVHLYPDIGSYTITLVAITQNGCVDTTYQPLEILQYAFYIPNAFTPGIDGKNDFFFGKGVGIVDYELTIFDRWGNQIFYCSIKDLPQTTPCMWDGKVEAGRSNERAQQDVYVWKVELLDIFGDTHSYIGTVTAVK